MILPLPLMILVAIAVKLTSRGPILYSQIRVGVDRRAFVDDRRCQAERRNRANHPAPSRSDHAPRAAGDDQPEIETCAGHARTPNGGRLREEIPDYPLRQRTRPGITGWAQVCQTYDCCLEAVKRKVSLDLEYLKRRTVWQDIKIMAMTIPVMIFRRGAM